MNNQTLINEMKENSLKYKEEFNLKRNAYIFALAQQETIEELDKQIKTDVLKNNTFKIDNEWKDKNHKEEEIIKNCNRDYLMSDEDFKVYMGLCHKERLKRGLNIPNEELTSDYLSFKILKQAEQEFLDIALNILPNELKKELEILKESGNYEHRKKFIDISLSLDIKEGLK